jgi:hypothetical protein
MFHALNRPALKQRDRAPSLMPAEPKGRPVNFSAERIAAMLVFGAVILGGMGLVALLVRGRQRMRELAIKERISLIEKGLVPSPEADPARFESFVGLRRPANPAAARFQSAGILIIGLGLALALLLSLVARIPAIGIGVGGGLAILGMAAFINGALLAGDASQGPGASEQ